jgi:hypothetical protein
MKTLPIVSIAIGVCLLALSAGVAFAGNPHPFTNSGTGQPGSNNGIACGGPLNNEPGVTIADSPSAASATVAQSPFNPNGQAGTVYAGNPGTASAAHSQSGNAVSQYDVACFQHTQVP